jgi:hypothetical protein
MNKDNILQFPMTKRQVYTKNNIASLQAASSQVVTSNNTQRSVNQQQVRQSSQPVVSRKARSFGNGIIISKGQKLPLNGTNKITVCVGSERFKM